MVGALHGLTIGCKWWCECPHAIDVRFQKAAQPPTWVSVGNLGPDFSSHPQKREAAKRTHWSAHHVVCELRINTTLIYLWDIIIDFYLLFLSLSLSISCSEVVACACVWDGTNDQDMIDESVTWNLQASNRAGERGVSPATLRAVSIAICFVWACIHY